MLDVDERPVEYAKVQGAEVKLDGGSRERARRW